MRTWDSVTRRRHLHGWSVPPRSTRTSCNFSRCIPSSIYYAGTRGLSSFSAGRTSHLEQLAAAPTIGRRECLCIPGRTDPCVGGARIKDNVAGLAGGGFGDRLGGFAVFADYADKGLRSAREATVAAIDEAELTPEVDAFDSEQFDFAGFHIILRKTLTDDGNASVGGDKALDHADAGQLHGDVNARAIRPEKFVEHLTGEASTRKNERLLGDFGEGDLGAMSERVLGADHEAQTVFVDVVHFQVGGLDGQSDDADVDGAVLNTLENFVAEVAVDADMH